jgi:hypothetical protein
MTTTERQKLLKKFDRLSTQVTKTRDLDKMMKMQRELYRIVDLLK